MNIYDIAKKANVSIATVSRVLNGSDRVKPATRQLIQKIIDESGFTKNDSRSRHKTSHMIGYICSNLKFHETARIAERLIQDLSIHGYHTILNCVEGDFSNLHIVMDYMVDKMEAVVLDAGSFNDWPQQERTYIIHMAKKIPILMINVRIEAPNIYNVIYDVPTVVQNFVEEQIKKEKEQILFLLSSMNVQNMRILDYYRLGYELNHKEPQSYCMHLCPDEEAVRGYITSLFDNDKLPDTILTTNEEIALYAKNTCLALGIAPGQIQVKCTELTELSTLNSLANFILQIVTQKEVPTTIVIPGQID